MQGSSLSWKQKSMERISVFCGGFLTLSLMETKIHGMWDSLIV